MGEKIIVLIYWFIMTNSCNSENKTENSIGGFDISKNDKQLLFSFIKEEKSSIYKMNIDGSGLKVLMEATVEKSYANPKYSIDGKSFVFIEYLNGDIKRSSICVANVDGKNVERLIDENGIVSEAIFSSTGNEIIYCKANEYAKYSPLGIKNAHGFDIYSLNLFNRKVSQLTTLNAYGMNYISEIDTDHILFRMESVPDGGLYAISIQDLNSLIPLGPLNDPRKNLSMYYCPVYSSKYNVMIFTAPYELYIMDAGKRYAELIYTSKGDNNILGVSIFNTSPNVLFTKQGESNFYSISLKGSDLKKIEFKQ